MRNQMRGHQQPLRRAQTGRAMSDYPQAVAFFSGGVSSYLAAKRAVQKYGADNTVLLFTDTMIEDEDLHRFLGEAAGKLGAMLVKIADGRDPWKVFQDKRYVGNTRASVCSIELKVKPAQKWVKEHCTENTVLVFGIDEFEAHRVGPIAKNWSPHECWFPLVENPTSYRERERELADDGLKRPRLYDMGFAHNNCGGFCVKAGQSHFATLYRTIPERYAHHAKKEREAIDSGINHSGIIRVMTDGVTKYLPLDEYAKTIESGLFDEFDTRGCGCFSE